MTDIVEVGTVEVLITRIYNLDPENHMPGATTVVVEPGTYPLFSDGPNVFWLMRGRINVGPWRRIGEGLFLSEGCDRPAGPEVTFPSKTFGRDEWNDFLQNDPTCADEGGEQRLRVRMHEAAS